MESFSWTPRSRKTFVREVPLLSRGRRSGLSRSGKTEKTGASGGLPHTDSPKRTGGGAAPGALEEAKLHRRTLGLVYRFTQRDPLPPHDDPFVGWGSVGRGFRGGEWRESE